MKNRSKANPFVVAVQQLSSAIRLKVVQVRDAKAGATLKVRSISVPLPRIPVPDVNRLFSVVAEWLAPLALLCVVVHQMMGTAFWSSQRFFGVPGDSQQYMWFIGWVWHAIELGQSPFVSHAFNYPHPITIMDYTAVPALGLLFGWLYAFTSVVFVYNLIVVVNYIVIFIFGKLTLRALSIGALFSSIGGFLFCLQPYLTAQAPSHLHLAFIAPLFMVGYLVAKLTHSVKPPGWGFGVITGFAMTLVFYTSLELLSTLVLCLGVLYCFALIACFKPTYHFTVRLLNLRFLLGIGTPVLLIVPGLLNFIQGQGPLALGLASMSSIFANDLLSFVVPSQLYLAHTVATASLTSRFSGNASEWDGYLSVAFIVLFLVYAVRGWKKPMTRIITYTAATMAVFSLGPYLRVAGVPTHVYLPWILMLHLPFIRDALPARLGLYTSALAIILVMQGADQSTRTAPLQLRRRPLKLNIELAINLATLALVGLLWLPLLPSYSGPMPMATRILRGNRVISRYIVHEPTLVLYDQDFGFSVVMGMLAASNDYGLVTSNIYGSSPVMAASTSFHLNQTFMNDTDGKQTDEALLQDLPQLGVGKVMFVSTDDLPISSQRLTEISKILGAPLFNNQGLVVVWTVPQNISS
jgi:hypothetical protein